MRLLIWFFCHWILCIASLKIDWVPIPKPPSAKDFQVQRATLRLPVEYSEPTGATFNFSVIRLSRGAPKTHLIMLAGGPGQKGTFYLNRAQAFAEHVQDDFVMYLPTHRGVGRSGKLAKSNEYGWKDLNGNAAQGIPPLSSVTVTNAARDIIELATAIKGSPDFREDSKLFLYGCSYGGLWGTRVLKLAPRGMFEAFLMNSPFVVKHFMDIGNDRDFIASCEHNPFCKAQLDGHPERIRNVVSYVGNPSFNGCTQVFHSMLERLGMGNSIPTTKDQPRSHFRLQLFLRKMFFGGMESSMATLPFLAQLYKCPSVGQFEDKVIPVLITMHNTWSKQNNWAQDTSTHQDAIFTSLGDGSSINILVNIHVMATELYHMKEGMVPAECRSPSPFGLFTDCPLYLQYKSHYDQHLSSHAASPDPLRWANLDAGTTKIIIYHSSMDTNTPLPSVEAFFNEIKVDPAKGSKHLHVSLVKEHATLLNGRCTKLLFDEFLRKGSPRLTELCFQLENGSGPDWEFQEKPALRTWWIPPEINRKLVELPMNPDFSLTGPLHSHLPAISSRTKPVTWSNNGSVLFLALLILTLPICIILYRIYRRSHG